MSDYPPATYPPGEMHDRYDEQHGEEARAAWPQYEGQPWPDCGRADCAGPETHAQHPRERNGR
jgi:hypothetical protein